MYHLQDIMDMLVENVRQRYGMLGKQPKEVYALMQKIVAHGVERNLFTEIESNPVIWELNSSVYKLIERIDILIKTRLTESSLYLSDAIDLLERMKKTDKPMYILLCDALSLSEYMFLIYYFHNLIDLKNTLCAINPSGKTSTFKYLAEEYFKLRLVSSSNETTMNTIAETLRIRLNAKGCSVFREFDRLIHEDVKYSDFNSLLDALFNVVSNLQKRIDALVDDNYKILILADHGYDIIFSEEGWTLTHKWREGMCLSTLVPILTIG